TAGAGKTDPSLPPYVGALPPPGVEAWDWQWTWDFRVNNLLTVSKDPRAGGRFRRLAEALKVCRPRMTVRALDDAVYPGPLALDDPERHEGLVLEAPRGATIALEGDARRALTIEGVPGVRVQRFRFRDQNLAPRHQFSSAFVMVRGPCPGVILEDLDVFSEKNVHGINIVLPKAAGGPPVIVRRCTLKVHPKEADA